MLLRGDICFDSIIFLKICIICAKKSSVAFVIDDTESMRNEIDQVKKAAEEIMNIVTMEKASEIEDVVLVTFNDPAVVLRKKTSSKEEYIHALHQIYVTGGNNYDCPEYALAGIEKALHESMTGSYIFVFTDATAKDYDRVNEIKSLCVKKQSQVIFILTGDCYTPDSETYKVYHEIAKVSTGQVFRVSKNDVKDIFNAIKILIRDQNTVITSVVVQPKYFGFTPVPFTVDDRIQYVLISISGKNVDLIVKNTPTINDGRIMYTEHVMWKLSGKVVKFEAPSPGTYYAFVKGETDISVLVYARTNFKFDHGFSLFVPNSLNGTSISPIADLKQYLSISVIDPEQTVDIKSAEILDINERVLATLSLKRATGDFYTTNTFVSPSSMFKIRVIGTDIKTGKDIRRISRTAIEPQTPPEPEAIVQGVPTVFIEEGKEKSVAYGGSIELTCNIVAYPFPKIKWKDGNGLKIHSENTIKTNNDITSLVKLHNMKVSGTYSCSAKNYLGKAVSKIHITVPSPIAVQSNPADTISSKFGSKTDITCDITSTFPLKFKWFYQNGASIKSEISTSDKYTVSPTGTTLHILSTDLDTLGNYTCEASLSNDENEKIAFTIDVQINNLSPPILQSNIVTNPKRITVQHNDKVQIPCKAYGVPKPTVTWQFKSTNSTVFATLATQGELITIPNIGYDSAGSYRCTATNKIGTQSNIIDVIVYGITEQGVPAVFIAEGKEKSVSYGSDIELTCNIVGYPLPKIEWTDARGVKIYSKDIIESNDDIESRVKLQNIKVSGTYSCSAENNIGKNVSQINITVSSPIVVKIYPTDTINSTFGTKTDITCDITSTFPLKFKWFYQNGASMKSEISTSDKYTVSPTGTTLHILSTDLDTLGKYTCEAYLSNDDNQRISFTIDVQINNLSPPLFQTKEPKKITVRHNDKVRIPCKIDGGIPPPIVSWLVLKKGDKTFRNLSATGQELIVESATLGDAGLYQCIAKNSEGKVVKSTELIVQKAPETFIDEGVAVTVQYGSTTEFICRIVAYPLPKTVWKDNKGHEMKSMLTITNDEITSHLKVKDIKASDTYSCYAENALGDNVTSVQVSVLPPIVIPTPNSGIIGVNYGKPADIHCAVKSAFPIKVKWFYEKNHLSNKTKIHTSDKYTISSDERSLHIISTDMDLVGKYTCEASLIADENEKTSFTTKIEINNLKSAEITKSETSITAMYNQDMTAICKTHGIPKPTVTWQFKSTNSTVFVTLATQGEQITIPNIGYESAGSYRCTATNKIGTQSSIIDVVVHAKPNITNIGSVYTGITGDEVLKIPCEVTGVPEPTITWTHNGIVVTSDSKLSVANNALFIKNPTGNDSKTYTCEAKNEYGSAFHNFKTTISEAVITKSEFTVMYRQDIIMTCNTHGIPNNIVTWQFKSTNTTVFATLATQGNQMFIPNIGYKSAGSYKCTATNKIGTQSSIIDVDVHGKPNITNIDSVYTGITGDKVLKIPCEVTGVPEPTITWTHNGIIVTSDSKLSVTNNAIFIKNPTEKDSKTYTCEAKNKYGSAINDFTATISDYVDNAETANNYHYLKPGESVDIKCHLPSTNPQDIRWYVNEYPNSIIGPSYSIKNAIFSNDGNYTCRLNTDQGSKSLNYVVDVGYKPQFTSAPSSLIIDWTRDKQTELDCGVRAKPRETVTWSYNGKQLDNHEAELAISGFGIYTCNISNPHGSVHRTFNVTSNGCFIDRTVERIQNTPLLVDDKALTWPRFDPLYNKYISVGRNEYVTLECSTQDQTNNTFRSHPNTRKLKAKCYSEDNFIINNNIYKFKDLQCKELVRSSQVVTKKPCMMSSEIVEVGFQLNDGFLGIYDVCYNKADNRTLYTKMQMSDVDVGNVVGQVFNNNESIKTGKLNNEMVECQFNSRWLVNPVDVAFGPAQIATLSDKYNAVPVYEPCKGSTRMSWTAVEDVISFALFDMDTITVWTGASDHDSNEIPRYLWKVVRLGEDTFEAIVYVNTPNPNSSDIVCPKVPLGRFSDITDSEDLYTYSCSMGYFSNAFNVPLSDFGILTTSKSIFL